MSFLNKTKSIDLHSEKESGVTTISFNTFFSKVSPLPSLEGLLSIIMAFYKATTLCENTVHQFERNKNKRPQKFIPTAKKKNTVVNSSCEHNCFSPKVTDALQVRK